jgi:hypothetical protein
MNSVLAQPTETLNKSMTCKKIWRVSFTKAIKVIHLFSFAKTVQDAPTMIGSSVHRYIWYVKRERTCAKAQRHPNMRRR